MEFELAHINRIRRELKAKVGQMKLKDLLRLHYPQLLEQTRNPGNLALILCNNDTINMAQMQDCEDEPTTFCKNLELYQILKKKNAGEALIDALYKTGNFHILRLLSSKLDESASTTATSRLEQRPDPSPPFIPATLHVSAESRESIEKDVNQRQISILKANTKIKAPLDNKWNQTIGEDNLAMLEESTLDWTLARVVTNCGNSHKYFQHAQFHPEDEQVAIFKFLKSQLGLDLDKKIMGRPPTEIYINARSFTNVEWQMLSKMLYKYCRDFLEILWFKDVDYREYRSGIKWMESEILSEDDQQQQQPKLWFAKLKLFIFQGDHYTLDALTFHNILLLIKSLNYPIQDFWNESKCAVQIWRGASDRCHCLMDPTNGALYLSSTVEESFRDQIEKLSQAETTTTSMSHDDDDGAKIAAPVPIVKLFYHDPRANVTTNGFNRPLLTHLFLWWGKANCVHVILDVINNLSHFSRLKKLMLVGVNPWSVSLKQLDILDNLSFLYFSNANCGGIAVETFPWRKSVRTLIFNRCHLTLATHGFESVTPSASCVMFERNREVNARGFQPQLFNVSVSKLSHEDVPVRIMREFCD